MREATDGELVIQAQAGDAEAFGELVKRHVRGVYAVAYAFSQDHADADDLAQEAFIEAYRSIGSFGARSTFRTWVYRIAANISANYLKRKAPVVQPLDDAVSTEDPALSSQSGRFSPLEAAGLSEFEELVAGLMAGLPLNLRVALHLVVNEGLSHKEAAEALRCPERTVAWRVFRARQVLWVRLSESLDGRMEQKP